jgi:phage shock protein E
MMTIVIAFLVALLVIAAWRARAAGGISAADARLRLREGAMLVDVRSRAEFGGGHLRGAINLPLDELELRVLEVAKEKNRPVLLHCASGMRSAMACRKLRSMGYPDVFNLGSYGRAEAIVAGVNSGTGR